MATAPTKPDWENRIVGYGQEDPTQLLANPRNWRIHSRQQRQALELALDTVGWLRPVIINQFTGHVVDGHLRVALGMDREEPTVPVTYVQLDEDEERAILASHDPLAELAQVGDGWRTLLAEAGADELGELLAGEGQEQQQSEPQSYAEFDEAEQAERERRQHELVCPYCGHEFEWDGKKGGEDEPAEPVD